MTPHRKDRDSVSDRTDGYLDWLGTAVGYVVATVVVVAVACCVAALAVTGALWLTTRLLGAL